MCVFVIEAFAQDLPLKTLYFFACAALALSVNNGRVLRSRGSSGVNRVWSAQAKLFVVCERGKRDWIRFPAGEELEEKGKEGKVGNEKQRHEAESQGKGGRFFVGTRDLV